MLIDGSYIVLQIIYCIFVSEFVFSLLLHIHGINCDSLSS